MDRDPIDQLAVYVRLQINDFTRRHLSGPGDAFSCFPRVLGEARQARARLQMVLAHILSAAIAENYIPKNDIRELAMLVHGSLSAGAGPCGSDAPDEETRERQILSTIRFI